ncbi:MAG: anaerobic glycerol-3-phosphate dehydrogenase subunit C [Candidatus Hodarchaeota archaeon]
MHSEKEIKQLGKKLTKIVEGEVKYDHTSRFLWSTDASLFEIKPALIVLPNNEEDVIKAVKFAEKYGFSVTPRGAGSSLGGQALGTGIIIDFQKNMQEILEINVDDGYCILEPGVRYGSIQKKLQKHGYWIPPDPSSQNNITIGGMIGNNASGAHSGKYGNTNDYVLELRVVLSDGSIIETRALDLNSDILTQILAKDTLESTVYRKMIQIWNQNEDKIKENWPRAPLNVAGYAGLIRIFHDGKIDLGQLITGCEGTLGIVTQAKIRIAKKPKHDILARAFFDSLEKAGKAIALITSQFQPSAIELIDKSLIEIAREKNPSLSIPDNLEIILMIEFDGDSFRDLESKMRQVQEKLMSDSGLALQFDVATEKAEKAELWKIRFAAVPLLMKIRDRKKVLPIVEDCAVLPTDLPIYLRKLYDIFEKYGIRASIYGHASKGLLHARPQLDPKDPRDIEKVKFIQDETFNIIQELKATMSGEHGDGRIRARFVKQTYGVDVFDLFREIKQTFDPNNLLNPDSKILDTEDFESYNVGFWRYGASYRTIVPKKARKKWYHWPGRSWEDEIELCHGCSTCNFVSPDFGRMCPVFQNATDPRKEIATPKAKANVLRTIISGKEHAPSYTSKDVLKIIDQCVGCDSCRMSTFPCPSNVNIAMLAMEQRAAWYQKFWGLPIGRKRTAHFGSGNFRLIGTIAARPILAPLTNIMMSTKNPARWLIHLSAGIHRKREMPLFTAKTFPNQYKRYRKQAGKNHLAHKRKIAYFAGCTAWYNNPQNGMALVKAFEHLGIEVLFPNQTCCGLPKFANGLARQGLRDVQKNIKNLYLLVKEGYDIITTCTSCSHVLRHYGNYYVGTEEAKAVSEHTFNFAEYLLQLEERGEIKSLEFSSIEKTVGYMRPCHLLAQPGAENSSNELLQRIPGLIVDIIEEGCCGLAGSYGVKSIGGAFDNSMKIGQGLFRRLKEEHIDWGVTDCPTCKLQMQQGVKEKPTLHPVELIAGALTGDSSLMKLKERWL